MLSWFLMSLKEQQDFLARIFTDQSLRHSFWENPEIIGQENGLDEAEIAQMKEIVSGDLNFFADSLFHKRLHEVEKLLPLTKRVLGGDFPKLFRQFSQTFQPHSIKKHLEDSIEFCKFLQLQQLEPVCAKDTARFEQTKHEFYSQQKVFSVCLLRHDIFSLKKKFGFSIWYRFGPTSRQFFWP